MDASEELYRDALGYFPQDFGYYPDFTGKDFLMYLAALKGLDKRTAKRTCAFPQPDRGARKRQYRHPLHAHRIGCGAYRGPDPDDERRTVHL